MKTYIYQHLLYDNITVVIKAEDDNLARLYLRATVNNYDDFNLINIKL